jgi:hypothetical protein
LQQTPVGLVSRSNSFNGAFPMIGIRNLALVLTTTLMTACTSSGKTPVKANVGANRTASVGERVILDGSKSTGAKLRFSWTLAAPPRSSASLQDPLAVTPSFTPDVPGEYVAKLTVTDLYDVSAAMSVSVSAIDIKPFADGGPDSVRLVGSPVLLDGRQSHGVGSAPLTYRWTLDTPPGSQAQLDHADAAMPSFFADVTGWFVANLVVNDGTLDSAPAQVRIASLSVPVPDAGGDRTVAVNSVVALDGSKSSSASIDTLTWRWTLSPPPGSSAKLDDASAVKPTFTADVVGTYSVALVVSDAVSEVGPVTIRIEAVARPVAVISPVARAWVGGGVTLDGSKSSIPSPGLPIYQWTLTTPPGSAATLSGATTEFPSFTADVAGDYVGSLVVSFDGINSDAAKLTISAKPHTLPVAVLSGHDVAASLGNPVRVNDIFILDGSKSTATDGWLSFKWTAKDPSGADVPLTEVKRNPSQMQFTVTAVGNYTITLVVNDGFNDSAPVQLVVTTRAADNAVPVADAGSDQTVSVGDIVQLDGTKSTDPDGDDYISPTWALVIAPRGSQASLVGTDWLPRFRADVAGTYLITLKVSDGRQSSQTVSVTITAR